MVARATAQATARTQWDGVYSSDQAERGRIAYEQHCATCHGPDLLGMPQEVRYSGQSARTPALTGEYFMAGWEGLSLNDLRERIRVSMPQQAPGTLSATAVTEVVAFILERSGYPAGSADLPIDRAALAAIAVINRRQ